MDMNSTLTFADISAPPPLPPQPPRSSFSCDRHPDEQFSGFCPSCLCERLTILDKSSSNTPSSSRRPSSASAAAAIKSLFTSSSSKPANVNFFPPPPPSKPSKPTSVLPQLRRTKSFSASKNESLGLSFEPQRKSCDVRGRNTLSSLFTLDDDDKTIPSASTSRNHAERSKNTRYESCIANEHVSEEPENEQSVEDHENVEAGFVDEEDDTDEITPIPDSHIENLRNNSETNVIDSEILGADFLNMSNNLNLLKDNLDIGTREKKSSGRGFWAAASVFSKKWHNWRRKQKIKRQNNGENLPTLPVEKPISKQFRETQSEVADYGFGRRSCDTDPRFSLDAGRISFDDPRYSFDEPRASWDGHLLGRSFPRMVAPMVSLMEDSPAAHVQRSDMQIPVEEPLPMTVNCTTEDEVVPGGSSQTKEYYSDSFSRRRKSLDRSSSMRKMDPPVVAEIDNKVFPAGVDYVQGPKISIGERDLRDSNSCSFRDDCSDFFELRSGLRDGDSVVGNTARKESKKTRRWSWRIWGLINRHGVRNKFGDEERYGRTNGVERSFSESWRDLNREGNADGRGGLERKVLRSNSTVSWRNSNHFHHAPFGSFRKSGIGNVLEKTRSGRFSLNRIDNEPLRIYLPPMSGQREGMNLNPNNSRSIARSVLRLY